MQLKKECKEEDDHDHEDAIVQCPVGAIPNEDDAQLEPMPSARCPIGAIPNEDDAQLEQLSQDMAKYLRYTAHHEELLGDDGWVALSDALPRLRCTAAQARQAVERSDRDEDDWGCGPRFEMYISGSSTWIRALNGAYYRQRSKAKQSSSNV